MVEVQLALLNCENNRICEFIENPDPNMVISVKVIGIFVELVFIETNTISPISILSDEIGKVLLVIVALIKPNWFGNWLNSQIIVVVFTVIIKQEAPFDKEIFIFVGFNSGENWPWIIKLSCELLAIFWVGVDVIFWFGKSVLKIWIKLKN